MTWSELKKLADELNIKDDDVVAYYDNEMGYNTCPHFYKWDDGIWVVMGEDQ